MEIFLVKDRYYEGIFLYKVVWKWDFFLSDWEKDKYVGNIYIFNLFGSCEWFWSLDLRII